MADTRDTDATRDSRFERGDAALLAQYIHELSERHGPVGQAARRAGAGSTGAASGRSGGESTDA